ncbi:MAG: TetR/AcrR family transcriptional regulator [Actinomycetota bacterium]
MPKVVDHDARRRQITDAVCRITLRGGLAAATFRQVAAEAGVSVRLVQHYFGTKAGLLDTTLQHVGERSTARLFRWIEETDGSARAVLGAFLQSFVPVDDESRMANLMYIALYTERMVASLGEESAAPDRETEVEMMHTTVLEQLERGPLRPGVEPEAEALLILALVPGLGQYVLDGTITADQARRTIDHHLDRLFDTGTDTATATAETD